MSDTPKIIKGVCLNPDAKNMLAALLVARGTVEGTKLKSLHANRKGYAACVSHTRLAAWTTVPEKTPRAAIVSALSALEYLLVKRG